MRARLGDSGTASTARPGLGDRSLGVEACRPVGEDGHMVPQEAFGFGVARATVMAAVIGYDIRQGR